MFENKRKTHYGTYIIVLLLLMFVSISFFTGYFLNISNIDPTEKLTTNEKQQYKIPDSLKNQDASSDALYTYTNKVSGDTAGLSDNGPLQPDGKLIFKTYFVMCGHTVEKTLDPPQQETELNQAALQALYPGWKIDSLTSTEANLTRVINTLCPNHYIIGIADDYIGIYVYNEDGEKVLKEKTDIVVSVLTPEDQSSLKSGIIADTEDDLSQKLEGLSN